MNSSQNTQTQFVLDNSNTKGESTQAIESIKYLSYGYEAI